MTRTPHLEGEGPAAPSAGVRPSRVWGCLLPVLALLTLAPGCGLMAFDGSPGGVNSCRTGDDCASGAVCEPLLGVCVAPEPPPGAVYLRFTYPDGPSGLHPVVRRGFEETASITGLPRPVTVDGWVAVDGPVRTRIGAQVTFHHPSGLPGEPAERESVRTTPDTGNLGFDWARDSTFALRLLPGTYALVVEPVEEADVVATPPLLLEAVEIRADGRLELVLPAETDLRRVAGTVARADGEPVPHLSVRAEDPVSGRRLSTLGTTAPLAPAGGDPDPPSLPAGWFEIRLPAGAGPFRLVIAPTASSEPFPTLVLDDLDFETLDRSDDGVAAFDDLEQPVITFPSLGLPVRFEGTVEGAATGGAVGTPVAGATLRFVRTVDTGRPDRSATFERVAVTDAAGRIVPVAAEDPAALGVSLLEGDYEVTVTPPGDSEFAGLHRASLRVAAPPSPTGERVQRGQVFQLGLRAALRGVVLDPAGFPAAAVGLEARLVEPIAGTDRGVLDSVVTGTTDTVGDFDLRVEPGRHLLLVRPPDATHYPWLVLRDLEAPDGLAQVRLENPFVLETRIVEGGPVEVEAFSTRPGPDGRLAPLGTTRSDADGAFRLLLAPSAAAL